MKIGSLTNKLVRDGMPEAYSYFVVDEPHERSMGTEILPFILKGALQRNKRLISLIMSATLYIFSSRDAHCH